jgi:hypothetical protein
MKYIVLASMAATLMISSTSAEIPKGNLKIAQSFALCTSNCDGIYMKCVGQYAGTDKIASICEVNVKACKANCG